MKARLIQAWESVRASYWFVPSIMAVGAVALSFATTAADSALGGGWMDAVGWLYANKPDGARALLSTIAGSMIGVAGVTFSITIAAVSYATGQFGPRLLTNFMRDRGNQVTLGTFIATFLYCLLVLRTIRSPGESATEAGAFVPHIAILVGIVFALASIGVLIFFIHHIPESIHASNVTASIARELNEKIDALFPERIGQAPPGDQDYDPEEDLPADFLETARAVCADGAGYVQYVNQAQLLEAAVQEDLLLRVEFRPGDFVANGQVLLYAHPPARASDRVAARLRSAFAWGRQRTQRQDATFLARELVEIASRALSPGTNDPFTAMTCMDWLGSALINLVQRDMPSRYRHDEDGHLRIVAEPVDFEDFCEQVFPPLRPYAEGDRNAALHLMHMIAEVGRAATSEDARHTLLRHARSLHAGASEALTHPDDRDALRARYRMTARLLQEKETARAVTDAHAWLGGSG